jgi:hypothetical protein
MRYINTLLTLTLLALLTACGGGGGDPGTTPGGGGQAPGRSVADFALYLDKSSLSNAGTETAKLTVVAVDVNNNVVANAPVAVNTTANTIFVPDSNATDTAGKFTGTLRSGPDKSDRQVAITVSVNGISKQTALEIKGSRLELSFSPALPAPGAAASATVRVVDAVSSPISGASIVLSGDIPGLAGKTATTNANGQATFSFTAPNRAGSYVVRVAASGVTNESSVQVGSEAAIPPVTIPNGAAPSLAASPNVVAPNTPGSPTNQSQLRFLLLDAQNNPVPNVRVRFEIASTGLGSVDSLVSTGSSTVYTNASGVATAAFIPGQTGSPTNGVIVRACYQGTDFASTSTCSQHVQVLLTIASQALAVSIGNDNLLEPGAGGTYIKQFVITVADSAGRAVANAPVDISLDITHYGKGHFEQSMTFSLDTADIHRPIPDATSIPDVLGRRVSCINEDRNRNGFVDAGENINGSTDSFGQATLEPRRSDIVLSYVDSSVRTTNEAGILLVQVEYSQRLATWLTYRLRATTNVAGSQGTAERAFVTTFIAGDLPNGSFRVEPYGYGSCSSSF